MRIAHNPKTGEYLGLQGGEWKPLRIAENKAGDRLYLGENGWEPLNVGRAETPDTKKDSGGDILSRGFSFGTRNILEGLGEIPQLINAPINAFFGTNLQNPGKVIADALGLQEAKTAGDEVLGAAIRGGAAALPTLAAGAAPAVAKAAPKAASFLSAAPVEQVASGMASGAAAEKVRQGGGGSGAQVAASVTAGLLPGTLSLAGRGAARTAKAGSRAVEALTEKGQKRIAAENLREMATDADRLLDQLDGMDGEIIPGSKPTLAQVTEDSGIASMEKGRASTSENRGSYGERYREQDEARTRQLDSDLNALAPDLESPAADYGGALRYAYDERYQAAKDRTRAAYQAIDPDNSTSFNLAPLRDSFQEIMPRGQFAAPLPADIRRFMAQIDDAIANGKTASYRDLQDIRTQLGDIITSAQNSMDGNLLRIAGGMKQRLDDYLLNAAEYADQPVQPLPGSAAYRDATKEARALSKARVAADSPLWDSVWGHLDADSLFRDFPDAKRELAQLHGRGLFARKGAGVPVDELADSLKTQGWLAPDADSSTLVELLKNKVRGKGNAAASMDEVLEGATQYGSGFTPEQAQAFLNAKKLRREQGELFEQGFNKAMARTGEKALRDDQIIGNYFKSGAAGDGSAKDFLRAFEGDAYAYTTLQDYVVNDFRRAVSGKTPARRVAAMQQWFRKYGDFLRNFPELSAQLHKVAQKQFDDVGRAQKADNLAAVKGSPTAQNLASQAIGNALLGGSLGRSGSGLLRGGGLVKNLLAAPVNVVIPKLYGDADKAINRIIDEAFLDPEYARRLLKDYKPFAPQVELKDVLKAQGKGMATAQAHSLLDLLSEEDKKKK
jgi:hypothetical protein